MDVLELKTVKKGALFAKLLVEKVKPALDVLNIDYDASGGVKDTLGAGSTGDAELATEASLSNLTKAELDDGMYVLTSVLKAAIDGSYSQLEKLASRADSNPLNINNL